MLLSPRKSPPNPQRSLARPNTGPPFGSSCDRPHPYSRSYIHWWSGRQHMVQRAAGPSEGGAQAAQGARRRLVTPSPWWQRIRAGLLAAIWPNAPSTTSFETRKRVHFTGARNPHSCIEGPHDDKTLKRLRVHNGGCWTMPLYT